MKDFDLKKILIGGFLSVFVIGGIFVSWKQKAIEVLAAPEEIKEIKKEREAERDEKNLIRGYVSQQIKESDFNERQKKAAPAGMRWSTEQQAYVKK